MKPGAASARAVLAAAALVLGLTGGPLQAAQHDGDVRAEDALICLADPPAVLEGEGSTVRAWAVAGDGTPLRVDDTLEWTAEVGHFDPQAPAARWDLASVLVAAGDARTVVATARARRAGRPDLVCRVQVQIARHVEGRGDALNLVSAKRHLLPGEAEAAGYGLYSYLLLPAPPRDEDERQRFLKTLEAYLWVLQDVDDYLARHLPPAQLNATYIPLKAPPARADTGPQRAAAVLAVYDYAAANVLLQKAGADPRGGPYLVSTLEPLSRAGTAARLQEDLTGVTPELAWDWIRHFTFLAAQQRSWSDAALRRFALNLRNVIAVGARVTPQVLQGLGQVIRYQPK